MCGEYIDPRDMLNPIMGSPPRVRGVLLLGYAVRVVVGITPACAGSTKMDTFSILVIRDHPRVCGEYSADG